MKHRPMYKVRKAWRQEGTPCAALRDVSRATIGAAGMPAVPEGSGESQTPRPAEQSSSRYLTPYHFSAGDRLTWSAMGRVRTSGTVVRKVNADVIRVRLETGKERDLCPCWCDYIRNETTGREYQRPRRAALTLISAPVAADQTDAPGGATGPHASGPLCHICFKPVPAPEPHRPGRPRTEYCSARCAGIARQLYRSGQRRRYNAKRRAKQQSVRTYRARKNRRAA